MHISNLENLSMMNNNHSMYQVDAFACMHISNLDNLSMMNNNHSMYQVDAFGQEPLQEASRVPQLPCNLP